MNADDTTRTTPRPRRSFHALCAACLSGAALASGGCLQSARHEFLACRADAPRPERGDRLSLAEALPSNIGPTAPPTALVDATSH